MIPVGTGVPPNSQESYITDIKGIIMVKPITSYHSGSKHNIHNDSANLLSKSSVSGWDKNRMKNKCCRFKFVKFINNLEFIKQSCSIYKWYDKLKFKLLQIMIKTPQFCPNPYHSCKIQEYML